MFVSDSLPLRRNPDFLKLWIGQSVSIFGTLISHTALPFVAILLLKATPLQLALLNAMDLIAGFLVGLFAGVWVDRVARRPILIGTDITRALLVLIVPLAALLGALRIELLYIVAFLTGALSTLFDVAYTAYLPSLIEKDQLMEGNSKLTATASAAEIVAFGSGGWLVQLLSAPFALIIDAVTFIVSAIFLMAIRRPETELVKIDPEEKLTPRMLREEIVEGLQLVRRDRELRALAFSQWALDFGGQMMGTLFILFVTRELGIAPGIQGTIYAIGGFTSLLGAVLAPRLTKRLGFGRTMILGQIGISLGLVFLPLAPNGGIVGLLCLAASQLLTDPSGTIVDIERVSLRQTIVSERMQGRVNATFRVGSMAVMLAGTFLAGYLGEHIGLRATLSIGVALAATAPLFIALSPIARRHELEAEAG